ncbi:MAG: hypothetical protein IT291_05385 [Deltaproteobacteria bacterium]|nr:hypothetical protein [Deltaproteobacteria bacterium]
MNCDKGAAYLSLLFAAFVVASILSVLFFVFGKLVPPNYIGVRNNGFTFFGLLEDGYSTDGLKPGLHWRIPGGVSEIILLPRGFMFVHLNEQAQGEDLNLATLEVPTTDGSKVKTDITLVLRYYDRKLDAPAGEDVLQAEVQDKGMVPVPQFRQFSHGGPRQLVESFTVDTKRQLLLFSDIAKDELKQSLKRLSTRDYYNSVKREQSALNAGDAINNRVSDRGIELWATLIRRYVYAERTIDDQIFAKNLQEQTEQLNAASGLLAKAQAETERERALWDAQIKDLSVKGETQVEVIRSEGELYEARKKADGDLLVAKARAEVDSAKASALSSLEGAEVYIAREMAPLVGTLKGGVVRGIDPYDVKVWVKKLVSKDAQ